MLITLLVCLSLPIQVFAQKPEWTDPAFIKTAYPEKFFLTELVLGEKSHTMELSLAIDNLKDIARSSIAKSIKVSITSTSESYTYSSFTHGKEEFNEKFEEQITTKANLEVNGIQLESYYDEENAIIYVLAVLNRFEAIGYYKGLINSLILKVESSNAKAKQYLVQTEKVKAKETYLSTIPLFREIEYYQGYIIALDRSNSYTGFKVEEINSLYNSLASALSELEQGITVYITSNAEVFGAKTMILENRIKGILSAKGCSFVDDKSRADWALELTATAREFNSIHDIFFSYADIIVNLSKAKTNQNVYRNEYQVKGGGSDFHKAAFKAYELASDQIAEKVTSFF